MKKNIILWTIFIIVGIIFSIWTINKIRIASMLSSAQSSQKKWNDDSKNQNENYNLRQSYGLKYEEFLNKRQYNKVIDLCLNEIVRDPKHKGDTYVDLGQVYNEQQKYDSAIYYYTKAITYQSLNAKAYASRGWTYNLLNMDDKALSDLFKAAYLDNNYLFSLGTIQEKAKQYDTAIKTYKKQLEIHPDYKECQDALNEVIEKKKNGL